MPPPPLPPSPLPPSPPPPPPAPIGLATLLAIATLVVAFCVVVGFVDDTSHRRVDMKLDADLGRREPDGGVYVGATTDWLSSYRWVDPEPEPYIVPPTPRPDYPMIDYGDSDWRPLRSPGSLSPSGYAVRTPGGTALDLL